MNNVFISSTLADLQGYRLEVRRAIPRELGMDVLTYEEEMLGSTTFDPKTAAYRLIDRSDIFVGIYAYRYGMIPEGQELSFTELEYQYARATGKPIFIFMPDEDIAWPPKMIDMDPSKQRKLARFKDTVAREQRVIYFTSPRDLASRVVRSIQFSSSFHSFDKVAGPPAPPVSEEKVTARPGETLFELAYRLGKTVDELLRENPQLASMNMIGTGEEAFHTGKQGSPGLSKGVEEEAKPQQVSKEVPESKPHKDVRVLNAGFAPYSMFGKAAPIAPDERLYADEDYVLLVDVGPVWRSLPSLVVNNEKAVFPEGHLPADPHGYLVRAVFVSEDFTPHLTSAEMWVPRAAGQSYPFVDGQRTRYPEPVRLKVHTPALEQDEDQRRAHGRLCLYYKGQLLQSALVSVGVASVDTLRLDVPNTIEVDYVLTSSLATVDERFGNRLVQIQQGEAARPVSVSLTLNDDGSGRHRILATYHVDTHEESTVPPAWAPYDAQASLKVLDEFRQAIKNCYQDLDVQLGKPRKQFGYDLLELAKIGDRLRTLALSDLDISETGKKTVALWRRDLLQAMKTATVVQVARTGPANYVFPWALVYEYPMPGPEYEWCKVITEWDEGGIRTKPTELSCPYAGEEWHRQNIICPYGFWGLKHIIEQPPGAIHQKDGQWLLDVSDKILAHPSVGMGVGITFDIDQQKRDQHLQRLVSNMTAHLDPQKPACDHKTAGEMLHDPEIVYFLCHGETDARLTPYLSIGEHVPQAEFMIYPNTLEQWSDGLDLDAWATKRPLVFINGCHTAQLQPGVVLNFVSAFADLGASGVIGTEVSVLADMAMVVAEAVLCRVSTGMEVGQAIREMRWELLNRGNVLGLAYTPYTLANLHLERTL